MNHVTELSLFSQAEMGRIELTEGFAAFRQCLKGKLNTHEAQVYLMDYMGNTVRLIQSVNDTSYQLSRFICFIKTQPVLREIFGSAFRDRVIDTMMQNKLMPLLDEQLVDDNYSTRKGKGALYGIKRVAEMIRMESENYTCDCYVSKDDIKSFFMSMLKEQSMQLWEAFIRENYHEPDCELVIIIMRKIINFRPELNCVRKGSPRDWDPMPPDKILGNQGAKRGFPVGKITSQMTALLFLDTIDHIITYIWRIPTGHYMDDRVMACKSLEKLQEARKELDKMHETIGLKTHPKKGYMQHYSKGVLFGGAMILPGRIYLSNHTIGNCFRRLHEYNYMARSIEGFVEDYAENFAQIMNSYFGLMGHFAEWNTIHRLIREIDSEWFREIEVVGRGGKYKVKIKDIRASRQRIASLYHQRTGCALCA